MEWLVCVIEIPIDCSNLVRMHVLLCLPTIAVEQCWVGCKSWSMISISFFNLIEFGGGVIEFDAVFSCPPVDSVQFLWAIIGCLHCWSELVFCPPVGRVTHHCAFTVSIATGVECIIMSLHFSCIEPIHVMANLLTLLMQIGVICHLASLSQIHPWFVL